MGLHWLHILIQDLPIHWCIPYDLITESLLQLTFWLYYLLIMLLPTSTSICWKITPYLHLILNVMYCTLNNFLQAHEGHQWGWNPWYILLPVDLLTKNTQICAVWKYGPALTPYPHTRSTHPLMHTIWPNNWKLTPTHILTLLSPDYATTYLYFYLLENYTLPPSDPKCHVLYPQ